MGRPASGGRSVSAATTEEAATASFFARERRPAAAAAQQSNTSTATHTEAVELSLTSVLDSMPRAAAQLDRRHHPNSAPARRDETLLIDAPSWQLLHVHNHDKIRSIFSCVGAYVMRRKSLGTPSSSVANRCDRSTRGAPQQPHRCSGAPRRPQRGTWPSGRAGRSRECCSQAWCSLGRAATALQSTLSSMLQRDVRCWARLWVRRCCAVSCWTRQRTHEGQLRSDASRARVEHRSAWAACSRAHSR